MKHLKIYEKYISDNTDIINIMFSVSNFIKRISKYNIESYKKYIDSIYEYEYIINIGQYELKFYKFQNIIRINFDKKYDFIIFKFLEKILRKFKSNNITTLFFKNNDECKEAINILDNTTERNFEVFKRTRKYNLIESIDTTIEPSKTSEKIYYLDDFFKYSYWRLKHDMTNSILKINKITTDKQYSWQYLI